MSCLLTLGFPWQRGLIAALETCTVAYAELKVWRKGRPNRVDTERNLYDCVASRHVNDIVSLRIVAIVAPMTAPSSSTRLVG